MFENSIHGMERLKNYATSSDWPIRDNRLRDVITNALTASGLNFVGVNSAKLTDIEYLDDETISFKAALTRHGSETKIRGIAHAYMSITHQQDEEDDPDVAAYLVIYWDLDT